MSVGRICSRAVHLVDPTESVAEAARRMSEQGVGTLIALGKDDVPSGILTDRDIVLRVVARGMDPVLTKAGDVMTWHPRCVVESTSIEAAVAEMRSGGCRRLPVTDGRNRLVGILSVDDVLDVIGEEMTAIRLLFERSRAGAPGR